MAKSRKSKKADTATDKSVEIAEGSEGIAPSENLATQIEAKDETVTEAVTDSDVEVADTDKPDHASSDESTETLVTEDVAEETSDNASEYSSQDDDAPVSEETGEGDDVAHLDAETSEDVLNDEEVTLVEGSESEATADTEDTPEPEETPEPVAVTPAPAPETQVVKGSIWPGFFGGVIAAMIGFIVGRGDVLDDYLPQSMQRTSVDITALETDIDAVQTTLATLQEQASSLEAAASAQDERIAVVENSPAAEPAPAADLSGVEAAIAGLADRVAEVESRPVAEPVVDTGASSEEVGALQAALEAQSAQIADLAERAEAAEANAASEAAELLARAALLRVATAVDSGEEFSPALGDLQEAAPVEVPGALQEAALVGVPTLVKLQDDFPQAARDALAAARSQVPEAEVQGISGFIKRQLNARSVSPREGADADAILSRMQAALHNGDLSDALVESEGLPEAALTAMEDWLAAASARKAAQDAVNSLADSLNSN